MRLVCCPFRKAPAQRLTELFNANNFIVSQVPSYWSWRASKTDEYQKSLLGKLFQFAGKEFGHRLWQLRQVGLLPKTIARISEFFQTEWEGDVLIKPMIFCTDIAYVLSNPTPEFVRYCMQKGQSAVWRRISNCEIRCAIEFAADDVLAKLKKRKEKDAAKYEPPMLRRARSIL